MYVVLRNETNKANIQHHEKSIVAQLYLLFEEMDVQINSFKTSEMRQSYYHYTISKPTAHVKQKQVQKVLGPA